MPDEELEMYRKMGRNEARVSILRGALSYLVNSVEEECKHDDKASDVDLWGAKRALESTSDEVTDA